MAEETRENMKHGLNTTRNTSFTNAVDDERLLKRLFYDEPEAARRFYGLQREPYEKTLKVSLKCSGITPVT